METAIQVKDASFFYNKTEGEAPIRVFEHLDLTIEQGTFVVILGHNGCGKSTLAKHFNAILLPNLGEVMVYGMDTRDENEMIPVRKTVGMVFQNPDNQIVANVVEEDVAFALENLGVPPKEIRERVDAALKAVGMYDYRKHAPHLLSGGQKQRVAIAGVLAMRPKCVVLDEPTAMLDPVGRNEVVSTIHELNEKFGVTVVLITHHMREATEADRVVVMNDGKIIADDTPKKVFSQVELLRDVGLTVPETTDLLYELNGRGWNLPLDALSVEECARAIYQEAANA
ncbi:MAG: energy-coupling factor transporter ATPase [Oscillospiraceae bacterium]|nr:energy-coupling factor transporter ATPase [Oscillospiraceae bacterium]